VWRYVAAIHVQDDRDVDTVQRAAYGVELREACGIGRAGASADDDGVGVSTQPASRIRHRSRARSVVLSPEAST